ncbi:MAG: SDR family NAD(P)-dependent oxidoreductase [Cyclobacteriaceae bacterium]|nr:SDR family NAD(P)-dependent oxidoreductase [Cyclobacteriaceae bacterium HetDA_MAG_MS6]
MKKTILVTGASGTLGGSVCKKFVESGHQVIGTGRSVGPPVQQMEFHQLDLTKEEEVQKFFRSLQKKYDGLDAAVLLAGGFALGGLSTTGEHELQTMYQLNFLTAYHVARQAFTWMKDTGGGNIIFTGAKPAIEKGGEPVLAYALSKGQLFHLSKLLNESGGEHNIVSSVIVPSIIDTPSNRSAMPNASYSEWVSPENIAEHITYLLSDNATTLREPVFKVYGGA